MRGTLASPARTAWRNSLISGFAVAAGIAARPASRASCRVVPAALPGSVGMLHGYIRPEERLLRRDVRVRVIDGARGPSIVQVPDFGGRFRVYQVCRRSTKGARGF